MQTNPNGANQHQEDPRQKLCWDLYINPKSKTFSNGYQSALKAGYEENTAACITTYDWFKEKLRKCVLVDTAEKNLREFLEIDVIEPVVTKLGIITDKEGNVVKRRNVNIMKVKADMTKFALSTLGKDDYSTRNELTGKAGKDLIDPTDPQTLKTILQTAEFALSNVPTTDTTPSKEE
jgi:hypothetical protein